MKIVDDNTFEINNVNYTLTEIQRLVDLSSTGANIHDKKNKGAIIYGYFRLLKAGEEMSDTAKKNVEDALNFLLK